jgi:ABC-2 type transport system permease protein
MRKIFIIALREYKAAVKTKSFIIVLFLMPVLMGGSMVVSMLSQNKVDTTDKQFVVIDHSALFSEVLQQAVKQRNESEIFHPETHEKVKPAYHIEFMEPDSTDLVGQKLALSERVKSKEINGFFEIGSSILHPDTDPDNAFVRFY